MATVFNHLIKSCAFVPSAPVESVSDPDELVLTGEQPQYLAKAIPPKFQFSIREPFVFQKEIRLETLLHNFQMLLDKELPNAKLLNFDMIGSCLSEALLERGKTTGDIDFVADLPLESIDDKIAAEQLFLDALLATLGIRKTFKDEMCEYTHAQSRRILARLPAHHNLFKIRDQKILEGLVWNEDIFYVRIPLTVDGIDRHLDITLNWGNKPRPSCFTSANCFKADYLPRLSGKNGPIKVFAAPGYEASRALVLLRNGLYYVNQDVAIQLKNGLRGLTLTPTKGFLPQSYASEKAFIDGWLKEYGMENLPHFFKDLEPYLELHYPGDFAAKFAYMMNLRAIFATHIQNPDFLEELERGCCHFLKCDVPLLRAFGFWTYVGNKRLDCIDELHPSRYSFPFKSGHCLALPPWKETFRFLSLPQQELQKRLGVMGPFRELLGIGDRLSPHLFGKLRPDPRCNLFQWLARPDANLNELLGLVMDALPHLDREDLYCIASNLKWNHPDAKNEHQIISDFIERSQSFEPREFLQFCLKGGATFDRLAASWEMGSERGLHDDHSFRLLAPFVSPDRSTEQASWILEQLSKVPDLKLETFAQFLKGLPPGWLDKPRHSLHCWKVLQKLSGNPPASPPEAGLRTRLLKQLVKCNPHAALSECLELVRNYPRENAFLILRDFIAFGRVLRTHPLFEQIDFENGLASLFARLTDDPDLVQEVRCLIDHLSNPDYELIREEILSGLIPRFRPVHLSLKQVEQFLLDDLAGKRELSQACHQMMVQIALKEQAPLLKTHLPQLLERMGASRIALTAQVDAYLENAPMLPLHFLRSLLQLEVGTISKIWKKGESLPVHDAFIFSLECLEKSQGPVEGLAEYWAQALRNKPRAFDWPMLSRLYQIDHISEIRPDILEAMLEQIQIRRQFKSYFNQDHPLPAPLAYKTIALALEHGMHESVLQFLVDRPHALQQMTIGQLEALLLQLANHSSKKKGYLENLRILVQLSLKRIENHPVPTENLQFLCGPLLPALTSHAKSEFYPSFRSLIQCNVDQLRSVSLKEYLPRFLIILEKSHLKTESDPLIQMILERIGEEEDKHSAMVLLKEFLRKGFAHKMTPPFAIETLDRILSGAPKEVYAQAAAGQIWLKIAGDIVGWPIEIETKIALIHKAIRQYLSFTRQELFMSPEKFLRLVGALTGLNNIQKTRGNEKTYILDYLSILNELDPSPFIAVMQTRNQYWMHAFYDMKSYEWTPAQLCEFFELFKFAQVNLENKMGGFLYLQKIYQKNFERAVSKGEISEDETESFIESYHSSCIKYYNWLIQTKGDILLSIVSDATAKPATNISLGKARFIHMAMCLHLQLFLLARKSFKKESPALLSRVCEVLDTTVKYPIQVETNEVIPFLQLCSRASFANGEIPRFLSSAEEFVRKGCRNLPIEAQATFFPIFIHWYYNLLQKLGLQKTMDELTYFSINSMFKPEISNLTEEKA